MASAQVIEAPDGLEELISASAIAKGDSTAEAAAAPIPQKEESLEDLCSLLSQQVTGSLVAEIGAEGQDPNHQSKKAERPCSATQHPQVLTSFPVIFYRRSVQPISWLKILARGRAFLNVQM